MPLLDTDRDAMSMLAEQFDPTLHCAEDGCTTSISFKTHWMVHHGSGQFGPLGDWTIFAGETFTDHEEAIDWFRARKTIPWYCSSHNGGYK